MSTEEIVQAEEAKSERRPRRHRRRKKKAAASNSTEDPPHASNDGSVVVTAPSSERQKPKQKSKPRQNDATSDSKKTAAKPRSRNHRKTQPAKEYPPHLELSECLDRYNNSKSLFRGKLRALPGKEAAAFVACDRGSLGQDIVIPDIFRRNRALDGDLVFVELLPMEDTLAEEDGLAESLNTKVNLGSDDDKMEGADDEQEYWQDDPIQMDLWNPKVRIARPMVTASTDQTSKVQRKGRVVYVVPPKSGLESELNPETTDEVPRKRLVGFLKELGNGTTLFTCMNRSLPQFYCPKASVDKILKEVDDVPSTMFLAEYRYGSWRADQLQWPPCYNIKVLGKSCLLEDELLALLTEFGVDHGDFPAAVLQNVEDAVKSGVYQNETNGEWGWRPTEEMYRGRRDYRKQRIFTIDPTTAKDLDDALHIQELPDGSIEVGVHIADVSFFVRPGTDVDEEAIRRATTVYLVDRSIPMLPRPLCEVACSLNENVERLAFSCVWRMNRDGTLRLKKNSSEEDVWYGRTVIRSCARLDYSTAQNIIENKVAISGKEESSMDDALWPQSRRPTGDHSIAQVAADVRLMNEVAIGRRRLRFHNGALALHSVKLTFDVDPVEGPLLAAAYPIRDSNRLVEEYMLLANYLVAQRLITHAGGRACLRRHPPPLMASMEKVSDLTKASLDYELTLDSSKALQKSLQKLGSLCTDPLVLQCVTQMMTLPMQQAVYFAAGKLSQQGWRHYALNSKWSQCKTIKTNVAL